jgi:hypothetical protein
MIGKPTRQTNNLLLCTAWTVQGGHAEAVRVDDVHLTGMSAARVYGWRAWRPTRLKRTGGLAERRCSRSGHPEAEGEAEGEGLDPQASGMGFGAAAARSGAGG